MGDRYLFKAKRVDNGEWVEGSLICNKDHSFIVEPVKWSYIGYCLDCNRPYIDQFDVDPSTICQCTGLTDKNGNKIWENDIVEYVYDGNVFTDVVIWDKSELDFKATNEKENYKRNFVYLPCCEEIKVIGNIFDNPELLEVEDE